MTKRFNKQKGDNPMQSAFLSMSNRVNRMVDVLSDPYVPLPKEKKQAILAAIVAIEQEWIIPGVNAGPDYEP